MSAKKTIAFVGEFMKVTDTGGIVNEVKVNRFWDSEDVLAIVFEDFNKQLLTLKFYDCSSDGATAFADLATFRIYVEAGFVTQRVIIDPGDIEIGAVELKSATNSNRAEISSAGELATKQLNRSVTGTIGAADSTHAVSMSIGDVNSAGIQLLGTWVATVVIEASMDNTNWKAISFWEKGQGGTNTPKDSVAANGFWEIASGGGWQYIRIYASAWTSGNILVTLSGTPAQGLLRISSVGSVGGIIDPQIVTTFNRTNDSNAYAANDVIADATSSATQQVLANIAKANGASGYVQLMILLDHVTVTPRFRIHLYNANPTTAKSDNTPWALDRTNDASKYLGYVDTDAANGGVSMATRFIMYKCISTSRVISFEIEVLDAYIPSLSFRGISVIALPDQNN